MMRSNDIVYVIRNNLMLPKANERKPEANVCGHCFYVNETTYSFCTNCGYPVKNLSLADGYYKRIMQKNDLLFKAESSVFTAQIVLYIMGAFLSLGFFFIFAQGNAKYAIVLMALLLSGLFFFLAFWSRSNPFSAMLTAFIILITFSAINIFGKLVQSFTTLQGFIGMIMCLTLLFIVLKGVQGAYRVTLIKQELRLKI